MGGVPDKLFVVVAAAGFLNAALGVAIVAVGAGIPGAVLIVFGVFSMLGAWRLQQHMRKQPAFDQVAGRHRLLPPGKRRR